MSRQTLNNICKIHTVSSTFISPDLELGANKRDLSFESFSVRKLIEVTCQLIQVVSNPGCNETKANREKWVRRMRDKSKVKSGKETL